MSTRATLRELRGIGLVEACTDPQLLGAAFSPWPMQRELLGLVEQHRLNVWALGRRSAKTTTAAAVAAWSCLLRPELATKLRPGERGFAVCVAVNHRQARVWLQALLSLVESSPVLADLIDSTTEDEVRFANGMVAAAFPCTSRAGRGYPIFCLVLDEAAHLTTESEGPGAAVRVWEAMSPSVAQFGRLGRVIVSSTPYGDGGFFADLFRRAESGEIEDAVAFQASTRDANPTIDADFLESERARDPEAFAGEYEAQFRGSGAAYLDPNTIDGAVVREGPAHRSEARSWIVGIDPAFSSDPFGIAVVGQDLAGDGRLILGHVQAWQPSKQRRAASFEERRAHEDRILDEVAAICHRYQARAITDQYAAPAVVDRLQRHNVSVRSVAMTATSKTAAFAELRARLNAGTLDLYPAPELLGELRRLRAQFKAGSASVINPRVGGSHGDMAQALAIAVAEHDRWGIQRRTLAPRRGRVGDSGSPWRLAELEALAGSSDLREPKRTPRWYDRKSSSIADYEF